MIVSVASKKRQFQNLFLATLTRYCNKLYHFPVHFFSLKLRKSGYIMFKNEGSVCGESLKVLNAPTV